MPSLRKMIDGSLELNIPYIPVDNNWKAQDDFMIRRKVNRSGPTTSEVLVGKILAMNEDGTAQVGIQKHGGVTQRAVVRVEELQPVTEAFKRSSIQYSPAYRPRV